MKTRLAAGAAAAILAAVVPASSAFAVHPKQCLQVGNAGDASSLEFRHVPVKYLAAVEAGRDTQLEDSLNAAGCP